MNPHRKLFPLVVFAALIPMLFSCAKKTVNLEYRFSKGEELKYLMSLEGEGTTSMSGLPGQEEKAPEVPIKISMNFAYRMVVKDVDEKGVADIETYLGSVKSVTESGGLKIKMEADEKGARMVQGDTVIKDSPGLKALKEIFKTPTRMKIDKRGNVLSVSEPGVAALALPQGDFSNLIKQSQFSFPEGPVAIGQSWHDKRDLMLGKGVDPKVKKDMDLTLDVTYTLDRLTTKDGRRCAEISMRGAMHAKDMKTDVKQGEGSSVSLAMVFDNLNQKIDGTIFFDVNDGLLVSTHFNIDQDVVMSMSMSGGEKKMKITSRIKMKLSADVKLVE